MPVTDLHPQYENKQYEFRQMRDTVAGTSNVKRSGSLYLPIPSAMAQNTSQPATGISRDGNDLKNNVFNIVLNAPWNHNIPAYSSYLQRARFPDMTSLLLAGLTGISIKKEAEIKLPSSISYLEESATIDGKSLEELFASCVIEVLTTGRYSLLLEVNEDTNKLFINTYSAESFINWRTGHSGMEKSTEVASLAVFQEACSPPDADEFSHTEEVCQVVLREEIFVKDEEDPNDDGGLEFIYNIQRYINEKEGSVVIPTLRGSPFPIVPLVTINADEVGFDVGNCPLLGVSDIAISIYQKDADMSNAEFLTCNPMLVTTGVGEDVDAEGCPTGSPSFPIGSNVTMNLPDPESRAYYVEPKSNCLQHMLKRIESLQSEAVQYGAAVLSQDKNGVEASETVKLRQSGNSSNLRTIIKTIGEGIEQILQYAYMWETNSIKESGELEFNPNLELIEATISPEFISAMLQSFLEKGISKETFVMSLKEGGVKLSGETVEGELAKIEAEPPTLLDDQ